MARPLVRPAVGMRVGEQKQVARPPALAQAQFLEPRLSARIILIEPDNRGQHSRIVHAGYGIELGTIFLIRPVAEDL